MPITEQPPYQLEAGFFPPERAGEEGIVTVERDLGDGPSHANDESVNGLARSAFSHSTEERGGDAVQLCKGARTRVRARETGGWAQPSS